MAENVESLEGIKAKVEQFSQDVKLSAPDDAVVVRNDSSNGIDRDNIAIANSFIVKNAREFRCIRVNEDPRTTNNIKWLSIEEVERIHINIIHQQQCGECKMAICPYGDPAPCIGSITVDEVEAAVAQMLKQINPA